MLSWTSQVSIDQHGNVQGGKELVSFWGGRVVSIIEQIDSSTVGRSQCCVSNSSFCGRWFWLKYINETTQSPPQFFNPFYAMKPLWLVKNIGGRGWSIFCSHWRLACFHHMVSHGQSMVVSLVHQVWPKPSCKAQWKGEEDKADRGNGGKTTSENRQA